MEILELSKKLPERIRRLADLSYNLWWSWNTDARTLFKSLDRIVWKETSHNPVQLLGDISSERLLEASTDSSFLQHYDTVIKDFDTYMSTNTSWFTSQCKVLMEKTVAYFSAEYALHNSLPIYAGGLGVLAGDYFKESSDLGIPLVGIGFMYPQGYFHQKISADGWQEDVYKQLKFVDAPISPVISPQGERVMIHIELDAKIISVAVWQVSVGRVTLYLLDTNVEDNSPWDRQLSARLYVSDREKRLQQEIILGIGGVRVLRAVGVNPSIWHANEGHTAFMMLERVRELVKRGFNFDEAARHVRANTVFTTHTPVPAGHDTFSFDLMEKYFRYYWESIGLNRNSFMELGKKSGEDIYNMTVLALRMSEWRNGVSKLHGKVCRKMWQSLWQEKKEDEVPILSITNGVHVPTWVATQMENLFSKWLNQDWIGEHDDMELWEKITDIPDEELWAVHQWLKRKFISFICGRSRNRWMNDKVTPGQALTMGALLDPDVLTIGFARRFTDYKRAGLLFHDIQRLKRIVQDKWRPVQIVFAGKSHPADERGKYLIQQIYNIAKDPLYGGRIAFVEDYDIHVAQYLVQGVDVWLNTPRILQEASGTSGQKAALNGVLNLSILDGWWHEGYNGTNGWTIGATHIPDDAVSHDDQDAESLYRLLEEDIVPLYYEQNWNGTPCGWVRMMKEAIRSILPTFCTRRMVKEYASQMYVQAAKTFNDSIVQKE
ncbi:MAG: alpha-glucan family phosphorylase [Thermodesulfobacteriota bacterium]|nr:alpha-glucan family phosphorylase [Thermodesulfobacteriota bacterium]